MSDESKAVTTISSNHMELVDSDMTKIDVAENELNEVISNLKNLADVAHKSTKTAAALADAAQHPDMYDSLSRMIVAGAKVNREAALAITAKMDLHTSRSDGSKPIGNETNTIGTNVLIATTTDVIEQIRNVMEANKNKTIGDD
jgi:hypothetical protein